MVISSFAADWDSGGTFIVAGVAEKKGLETLTTKRHTLTHTHTHTYSATVCRGWRLKESSVVSVFPVNDPKAAGVDGNVGQLFTC